MKPLNFNSLKKGAIVCALFCAIPSIAQSVEPIMGAEIKAGKLNVAAEDLGSYITILSRKDIANIPLQTTSELLGYIEGPIQ